VEGLVRCGESVGSEAVVKCCENLLEKQNDNGGWGEDFSSCYDKDYAKNGMQMWGDEEGSGVVNTSWAIMALLRGGRGGEEGVRRGIEFLKMRQLESGDWRQEGISGVFNRACGITYTQYRNVFPIWALARYKAYLEVENDNKN